MNIKNSILKETALIENSQSSNQFEIILSQVELKENIPFNWELASKKEKRIAIAKDILIKLEKGNIIPNDTVGVQKIKKDRYKVCALGSLYISLNSLQDKIPEELNVSRMSTYSWNSKEYQPTAYLKCFSEPQLKKIEDYFKDHNEKKKSSLSLKEKLQLIAKNIIENNGKFKPKQIARLKQ